MSDNNSISQFSQQWLIRYADPKSSARELLSDKFGQECSDLGFKCDGGKSFIDKYGYLAFHDYLLLCEILEDINDSNIIGAALFSQWRNLRQSNHTTLEFEIRIWFALLLKQLVQINSQYPESVFASCPKKMLLISNNIVHASKAKDNDIVEQIIQIDAAGNLNFTAYDFTNYAKKGKKAESKIYKIPPINAKKILLALAAYFSCDSKNSNIANGGQWTLKIENDKRNSFTYHGSVQATLKLNHSYLSDLIRNLTGLDHLYAFDGNKWYKETIESIRIDYRRISSIKEKDLLNTSLVDKDIIYKESLVIDRESDSIEYIQNLEDKSKVSRKFEIPAATIALLDNLNAKTLFSEFASAAGSLVDEDIDQLDYKIIVEFQNNPSRKIEGKFDKYGLPSDYPQFAFKLLKFFHFYDLGQIFNPKIYGSTRRRGK